jgi:hypothetical protein
LQTTVAFRLIQNGVPNVDINANPTLPTNNYVSPARPSLGIAVVNTDFATITVTLQLYDTEGRLVGQQPVSLASGYHASFNLTQKFPSLSSDFVGAVVLASPPPSHFIAWTLNADGGILSALPDGRGAAPVSQTDRIRLIFSRVLLYAQQVFLGPQPVALNISREPVINALGGNNAIQINLALAELINDSPSELAFAIGHELGHVNQQRLGRVPFYPSDIEFDADIFGLLTAMGAGYDPYAAAGTLAKLAFASGTAGLVTQFEAQIGADAHKSFNTRLDNLNVFINLVCGSSAQAKAACDQYRSQAHPHFPPSAPLTSQPAER